MPQNRKQRRAAAAAATASDDFDASSIPLSKPPEFSTSTSADRTRNWQAKTLLEIAAERQEALNAHLGNHHVSGRHDRRGGLGLDEAGDNNMSFIDLDATETQFLEISSSGHVSTINPNDLKTSQQATATHQKRKPGTEKEEKEKEEGEAELPPLIDTLFTSIPLTTVHFTLAFLAAHQYVQEIIWSELVRESLLIAFPVLTFCIHLAHGHVISFSSFRPWKNRRQKKTTLKSPSTSPAAPSTPTPSSILRQALIGDLYAPRTLYFFLPLAILLGALLVQTTNQAGYYAIMRRAPSIGTMWVWCVLEISSPLAALLALVIPLAWGVGVMGYKIY